MDFVAGFLRQVLVVLDDPAFRVLARLAFRRSVHQPQMHAARNGIGPLAACIWDRAGVRSGEIRGARSLIRAWLYSFYWRNHKFALSRNLSRIGHTRRFRPPWLPELHAQTGRFAPGNPAGTARLIGVEDKLECAARRDFAVANFEAGAAGGEVANDAFDRRSAQPHDLRGLQRARAGRFTAVNQPAIAGGRIDGGDCGAQVVYRGVSHFCRIAERARSPNLVLTVWFLNSEPDERSICRAWQ
jgi:hypothetical protein